MEGAEAVGKQTAFSKIIESWQGYAAPLVVLVTYVAAAIRWGFGGPFQFLWSNRLWVWGIAATAGLVFLWCRVHRLTRGFSDSFRGNIGDKWDFVGKWSIPKRGVLEVTHSDPGGLTKMGALWENYDLTFQARILHKCIGVVVRAQDPNNYYMFQIQKDRLRPHRRISLPVLKEVELPGGAKVDPDEPKSFRLTGLQVAWQLAKELGVSEREIDPPLADWFRVKVSVRGEAVAVYINGRLMFTAESFLKIPIGRVGFRNSHEERALVRAVRVKTRQ